MGKCNVNQEWRLRTCGARACGGIDCRQRATGSPSTAASTRWSSRRRRASPGTTAETPPQAKVHRGASRGISRRSTSVGEDEFLHDLIANNPGNRTSYWVGGFQEANVNCVPPDPAPEPGAAGNGSMASSLIRPTTPGCITRTGRQASPTTLRQARITSRSAGSPHRLERRGLGTEPHRGLHRRVRRQAGPVRRQHLRRGWSQGAAWGPDGSVMTLPPQEPSSDGDVDGAAPGGSPIDAARCGDGDR